jgi:hypothetical protein
MMYGTKVIVPRRERKATERGARKGIILVKATLFSKCWNELKDKNNKYVKNNFMAFVQRHSNNISGDDNKDVINMVVKELYKDFFSQSSRISYLRSFEKLGANLMFCNDDTIKTVIIQHIRSSDKIKSKKHISNIFNDVYLSFYAIGRERKWCDQDIIIPDYGNGVPVINAGNPLTKEVEKDVLSAFNDLAKHRPSRLVAEVDIGEFSSDDEEQDGKDKKIIRLEKQGLPASIAVIHYVIIRLLYSLFDKILRLNDVRPMQNLALLILLWSFTMHEGARPGDTMFGSYHKNLIFWFGDQFPLLTLAFVKIETLEYLLKGNHIKKFYFESWKGKQVREYRGRWHCFLPCQYNSLDLAWVYVIIMRVLAFACPSCITSKIFNKPTTNLSEIRRTQNKGLGIYNLVMYSIRYAFAEESVKYLLEIPRNWVRYVMGHFPNSHMSQRYANNLNQRVEIENIKTLLGADVCNEFAANDDLPLRFRTVYTGAMNELPADTPQHIIEDLQNVKKAINKLFSKEDKTVADSAFLMERVAKTKVDFMQDMKRIPFGNHFIFKEGLLSDNVKEKLGKAYKQLSKVFATCELVGKPKQVIWSYGQVMFGEWHTEEKAKAIKEFKEYKEQKTRVAMEYVITSTELPFPKSKKRKIKEVSNETPNNKLTKLNKVAETAKQTTIEQEVYEFFANQIEVGDIIVIVCSIIDKWSIPVPNTSKHVWVCSVLDVKIVARKVRVVGQFFNGHVDELLFDHNSQQVVDVRDDDIANILSGIQQVAWFQFEDDEIAQIINFCKTI